MPTAEIVPMSNLSPVRTELWTSGKWLTTPSLQPPFTLLHDGTEVWTRMIVEFLTFENTYRFGLVCGQSMMEIDQVHQQEMDLITGATGAPETCGTPETNCIT